MNFMGGELVRSFLFLFLFLFFLFFSFALFFIFFVLVRKYDHVRVGWRRGDRRTDIGTRDTKTRLLIILPHLRSLLCMVNIWGTALVTKEHAVSS